MKPQKEKRIIERKLPETPTGEVPRSRLISFYRAPNGEKYLQVKRTIHGDVYVENFTLEEIEAMFDNA